MSAPAGVKRVPLKLWHFIIGVPLFLAAYWLLFRFIGNPAMVITAVPLYFIAYRYGRWTGVAATLASIPFNLAIYYLFGGTEADASVHTPFWAASAGMAYLFYQVGLSRELRDRLSVELESSLTLVEQLRIERDRVRASSEAKDELLMGISHDLRTPLSAIVQSAQLVETDPEQARSQARLIRETGRGLLGVINKLLAGYRSDAPPAEAITFFNLHRLLDDLIRQHAPLFHAGNLDLRLQWDARLPEWVEGRPIALRRILGNLFGNSLKHTETGGALLEANAIGEGGTATELQLTVADSGCGIPPAEIPSVLAAARDRPRPMISSGGEYGYGLGLGNCLRLSDDIGAELSLAPNDPHGLKAVLRLPLIAATQPTVEETRQRVAAPAPVQAPVPAVRALVVDDDGVSSETLANALRALGADVCAAATAGDAQERAASEGFDVALLDLQLPDMDGIGLAHRLRATLPDATLVLFSANILLTSRQQWLDDELDLILSKPASMEELAEICRRAAEGREAAASDHAAPIAVAGGTPELSERQRTLMGEYLDGCLFAFGSQDLDACGRHAHKLAGAAATLRLNGLSQLAAEVERCAFDGDSRITLFGALRRLIHAHQSLVAPATP